jgi:exonuclease III
MLRLSTLPSSDEEDSPSPEPPRKRIRIESNAKLPSTYRIFLWNCDDITPYLPPPKTSNPIHSYLARVSPPPIRKPKASSSAWTIRSILQQRNWPEFFCLQEVKILANDKALITRARNAAISDNDGGPEYIMYSTLPVIAKRVSQNRRMYGVITYVREDVAQRIQVARDVDWDDEGRVLVLEMPGFALLNVYAVNGTDSPYVVRSTGEVTGRTRHERKRQFNMLLKEECLRLTAKGFEICIVGDINISRARIDSVPRLRSAVPHVLARKEFNEIFLPETGLIDAWRQRHGEDTKGYTWFFRGKEEGTDCARVDMILVSKGVYNRTKEVEIEKWGGMPSRSDHAIMWIEITGFDNEAEKSLDDISDIKDVEVIAN